MADIEYEVPALRLRLTAEGVDEASQATRWRFEWAMGERLRYEDRVWIEAQAFADFVAALAACERRPNTEAALLDVGAASGRGRPGSGWRSSATPHTPRSG